MVQPNHKIVGSDVETSDRGRQVRFNLLQNEIYAGKFVKTGERSGKRLRLLRRQRVEPASFAEVRHNPASAIFERQPSRSFRDVGVQQLQLDPVGGELDLPDAE